MKSIATTLLLLAGAQALQKSDADGLFKLMDANVTRGNLKNLVTDKPSPITVGLAQVTRKDSGKDAPRGSLTEVTNDKHLREFVVDGT